MRVLLLHPEDSPRRGPWSAQRWDLIVDLGRSSTFSTTAWAAQTLCPVLRSDSFRHGIEDLKLLRQMFAAGRGRLLDQEGIDWWHVVSLLVSQEAETVLVMRRLAAEIKSGAELWTTRPGWPVGVIGAALGQSVRSFSSNPLDRVTGWAKHYGKFFRRFSSGQMKEIFLDKYDLSYQWRARFASRPSKSAEPVILLPSAYENVSRMAVSYASLLPEQPFLLVATRRSAKQFKPQPNVRVQDLAAYATTDPPLQEIEALLAGWNKLRPELCSDREFDALSRVGIFESFPKWFHDGLIARNIWRNVLADEPICGVLCGDDSNPFTRLPVLLASNRKIPTVDFHHGALDGRSLLKDLPSDVCLAKGDMERDYLVQICGLAPGRVAMGAPPLHQSRSPECAEKTSAIFFSEPYETAGTRVEEVYRELLPPLCRLAREHGRGVIIKLHPFESASERKRVVQGILSSQDSEIVTVLDGPLSANLLARAWFGITIESTTVVDCVESGVPCFLCRWITLLSYGYGPQYARFGVGQALRDVSDVLEIPRRIEEFHAASGQRQSIWKPAQPEMLRQWLGTTPAPAGARSTR